MKYVDATVFLDCGNLKLRVYRASYAYDLLNDGAKMLPENYAQEHGTDIGSLGWITIPEYEVIE